jgi:hypothetical protein
MVHDRPADRNSLEHSAGKVFGYALSKPES